MGDSSPRGLGSYRCSLIGVGVKLTPTPEIHLWFLNRFAMIYILTRAAARMRLTFLPRKVSKSIRSDAQPFGFPRVLGQTGEAVNSLRSNRRPLVSFLSCAVRLRVSRRRRTNQTLL